MSCCIIEISSTITHTCLCSCSATANEGLSEPPSTNLSSPEPEAGGGPAAVRGTKCAGAEGVAPDAPSVAVNGNTEVEEGPATAAAQQHSKVKAECIICWSHMF
jgi:hypothetical protein